MSQIKNDLEKLEELTNNLSFKELVISRGNNHFEVPGKEGYVDAFILYQDEKISIIRSFGKSGTILPFHRHQGKEFFGVITGSVEIYFEDGQKVILKEGEGYEISDSRFHNCIYLENTWLWLVTCSGEFPVKKNGSVV